MSNTFYSTTKKAADGTETTRKVSNQAVLLVLAALLIGALWYFDLISVVWLMQKVDTIIGSFTK